MVRQLLATCWRGDCPAPSAQRRPRAILVECQGMAHCREHIFIHYVRHQIARLRQCQSSNGCWHPPSLTSNLSILAEVSLLKTCSKVLPDFCFESDALKIVILNHDHLSSVPRSSLSGIVSCDAGAIWIRIRIVRCQRPAKRQKHKHCETQAHFSSPTSPCW